MLFFSTVSIFFFLHLKPLFKVYLFIGHSVKGFYDSKMVLYTR